MSKQELPGHRIYRVPRLQDIPTVRRNIQRGWVNSVQNIRIYRDIPTVRRNVQECTRNIQTGWANGMQKYIGNLCAHEQFGSELTLTYLSILTDIDLLRRYTNSVQECTRMYQQYAEILTSILLKSVSTRSMASTPKALACVTKLCRAKSTSRASLVLTPPACVFSCMLCVCVRGGGGACVYV